ncbi:MAG: hypothetical protein BWY69_00504 [Planctomycetes bacterium ADurb.Bin401]|nr:MAG: hypothetical protein BWY69_00504 [Planctomycetes bacterium ADurb.Bin401]
MNKSILSLVLFLAIVYFASPVFGLKLSGGFSELTVNSSAVPATFNEGFEVENDLVVWIDYRDAGVGGVYASLLSDAAHTEYAIDVNAPNVSAVRTDGRYIAYPVWDESMQGLRIADLADIGNPVIKFIEITGSFIDDFDIDSGVVVYKDPGDSYLMIPPAIYAVWLSDADLTKHVVKEFAENDYSYTNISIESNRVVWSGEFYDDVNYVYFNYIDVADITDIAAPAVSRNLLPQNQDGGYIAWMNYLTISGDWLIARGTYNGVDCIYGLKNLFSPQDWSFNLIKKLDGYRDIIVRADMPYLVWAENETQQPQDGMYSQNQSGAEEQSVIYGAILFDNGKAVTSVLKTGDDNRTLMGADVSGGKVVWGTDFVSLDPQTEYYVSYSDLFADILEFECGDKGYSLADLNGDCTVNFADFAMFAERWLVCTKPDDINCTDGEVFVPAASR